MWISKRALVTVLAATIGVSSMVFAAGAFGALGASHRTELSHQDKRAGEPLIHESLAPSQVTDPVIHGVSPGGLPWVLKRGDVRVARNGKLDLRVKGLVIPSLGTPGPVTMISASLYCGADSTAADTTQQVPLSRKGDARIRDASFSVPSTCLAPVVLVHPNVAGGTMFYIALDGWRL
jgi:hypothetical protein